MSHTGYKSYTTIVLLQGETGAAWGVSSATAESSGGGLDLCPGELETKAGGDVFLMEKNGDYTWWAPPCRNKGFTLLMVI